jgi:FPC/CPF motif-containing protein YcgG
MRHEPLAVDLAIVMEFESPKGGPIEPGDISVLWTTPKVKGEQYPITSMTMTAWLMLHYDSLHDGHWPQTIRDQTNSHTGAYCHGPQEVPAMWAAEVATRVAWCGEHGQLCWKYYHQHPDEEAWYPAPEQCRDINQALLYCSGWKRRPFGYLTWRHRHGSRVAKRT